MKLSIVLLTWNSYEYLEPCLDSILAQQVESSEIIIVDNGSEDETKQTIQEKYKQIKLIENEQNLGVGPARNQGIQQAVGEYILILDIDTVVHDGAIHRLVEALDADPNVGVGGARLIDVDGNLQLTCRGFPSILSKVFRQLPTHLQDRLLMDEELRAWDHKTKRRVGYVIGACQLLRRSALDKVGIYDDRIFYGPEDVDLCLRMWDAGWKVLYIPEAAITHVERRITRKKMPWRSPVFWKHIHGLGLYFFKHRYLFRPPSYNYGLVMAPNMVSDSV